MLCDWCSVTDFVFIVALFGLDVWVWVVVGVGCVAFVLRLIGVASWVIFAR